MGGNYKRIERRSPAVMRERAYRGVASSAIAQRPELRRLLLLLRAAGGDGAGGTLGVGDAEHRLAVLALHELAAHLIGHRQDLPAAKVRADQLTRHSEVSVNLIGIRDH